MIEKRCRSARPHKPHWWSRTTKKTVTEETAGDTFQCLGAVHPGAVVSKDTRGAQIAADARSRINWASSLGYGPACLCGFNSLTPKDQRCYRHG
jgi:hypothetical protein